MKDKLCITDRRWKLLDYLSINKFATRAELAELFNVSKDTIDRDIVYLSSHAPISTQQGNGGRIIISPEYRSYKSYLTDAEEELLYKLMKYISNEEKRILCAIITKFTKNPMHEHSSFQNQNEQEELNACDI